MYPIKLDYKHRTLIIPPETVTAMGSPEEINMLFNPEQKIIALTPCPRVEPGAGNRKGRANADSIILSKHWVEQTGDYRIDLIYVLLETFSRSIPNFDYNWVFVLDGDFISDSVLGFDLTTAVPADPEVPRVDLKDYQVVRKVYFPKHWRGEAAPAQ